MLLLSEHCHLLWSMFFGFQNIWLPKHPSSLCSYLLLSLFTRACLYFKLDCKQQFFGTPLHSTPPPHLVAIVYLLYHNENNISVAEFECFVHHKMSLLEVLNNTEGAVNPFCVEMRKSCWQQQRAPLMEMEEQ